jgi:arginase family enzyme
MRSTATRVAQALLERDRKLLVLGGDCTVGIGSIAGIQATVGDIAVVYFDLHSDLNTPASATDGALDWMALAHMLALEGTESTVAAAAGTVPLLESRQVLLFAQSPRSPGPRGSASTDPAPLSTARRSSARAERMRSKGGNGERTATTEQLLERRQFDSQESVLELGLHAALTAPVLRRSVASAR